MPTLAQYPAQTLADAGYRSEAVFEELGERTDLIVALGREGKQARGDQRGQPAAHGGDGQEDEDGAGTHGLPATQMAGRTAQRLDQERLGFRQFSMRGLHKVQAEWKLVCMALNLRRMATMQTRLRGSKGPKWALATARYARIAPQGLLVDLRASRRRRTQIVRLDAINSAQTVCRPDS
jgi:hypothetical protein